MRIQDGFFGKRIFPERKFTVDFEWIMKSVIRSRMYSVFQNDVPGDRKQKCVENKRITTNTRFSQFSNLDQILFYVKFVHFYENNSLRSILHFTLDEKLPNSIYSKKKRKKSWKDIPFSLHLLNHIPWVTLYTTKQRIRHSIQQCQQYVEEETVER